MGTASYQGGGPPPSYAWGVYLSPLFPHDKIAASFLPSSCILQSKQSSFVINISLLVKVTVTVVDLLIEASVPDTTYRFPNPSSHRAMTLKDSEVHVRHWQNLRLSLTLSSSLQGTIGKLSDYILLTIFRYYLDASPRNWPKLVHICRRWRRITFASQRSLHLRLFCTSGAPVLETLSVWPALPIVVQYGGSPSSNSNPPVPPVPEDEDNIVAALKQFDRVHSIILNVTKPLLEKLSAIRRPFSELENLTLQYDDDVPLTISSELSSAFRWGPRLRNLYLSWVAIPALPRLLFLSTALVNIQLHGISNVGYISPEAFANALSGMPRLRTISLHFLSSAPYPDYTVLPLPRERVTLLALKKLKYRGTSKYLDSLAARIDAPRLGNVDITFFSQPPPMDCPQLGQFINRFAMHHSHRRADILFSENATSISFTQPELPTRLELQVSCESFAQQLENMIRICNCLYSFLSCIEHLRVCATRPTSVRHYNHYWHEMWQSLLRIFRGTKWAYVACGHWTSIIIAALRQSCFPSLHKLCIPEPHPPWRKTVESFIQSRLISGHFIAVEYERSRMNGHHGTGTAFFQR